MDRLLKTFLNSYALVGFFAVFGFWLFFKKKNDEETKDFKDVSTSGSKLLDAQAKVYADVCYSAFNHTFGFDDLDTLKKVLLPLDNPSFNHVYMKFGKRQDRTLIQWLTEQLSVEEIEPFRKFTLVP